MEQTMLYHIYRICVGEQVYIGSTKNIEKRWLKHQYFWLNENKEQSHLPQYGEEHQEEISAYNKASWAKKKQK